MKLAPNLNQRTDLLSGVPATAVERPGQRWFSEARLGMFIHYGLYSMLGRGEWVMFQESIPVATYNQTAAQFTASDFSAPALARMAKSAGAGYVVLTTRHHDGFCLWDTRTTDFNSVRSPARRDLVREFVDACRAEGLCVGLYHSIMSWQWPAIITGPGRDPEGWARMVAETHAQVRELLTNYGQIDVLWYDGCVVPGVSDEATIAHYWRAADLNAMVRSLQPDILINDRSCLPEDYSTPEQHLTLPPVGRRWEMCMTLGKSWGWRPDDIELKTVRELIDQLVFCARYDGNLLINVSPDGSGKVPDAQTAVMRELGDWIAANGKAVRATRRTAFTGAEHEAGLCTSHGSRIYFHNHAFAAPAVGDPVRIAGVRKKLLAVHTLASGRSIPFTQTEDGLVTLDLASSSRTPLDTVLALEFDQAAPENAPPARLRERDTGLYAPAEAAVHECQTQCAQRHTWAIDVPATGIYSLEICVVSEAETLLTCTLSGSRQPPMEHRRAASCGSYPNTLLISRIECPEGTLECSIEAPCTFKVLSWRLQPSWRCVESAYWKIIGPFASPYCIPGKESEVREAMRTQYPPELQYETGASYGGVSGPVSWQQLPEGNATIDFTKYGPADANGVYFARLVVHSPDSRTAALLLGCDWWANVIVNGSTITSTRSPAACEHDGSWFSAWKPLAARMPLRQGENVILVKCHQGRAGNWFRLFLHESPDLLIGDSPSLLSPNTLSR